MEQIPINAAQTSDLTLAEQTPQLVSATPVHDPPLCADHTPTTHGTPPSVDLLDLSTSQVTALEALAAGQSLGEAARAAGVNPSTVYRWKKSDPRFVVALNAWRIEVLAGARDRILALTDQAVRAAHRLLLKDNPAVTVAILKSVGSPVRKPGVTDVKDAADAIRQEEQQRHEERRSRLWNESEKIRLDARCAVLRKEGSLRRLQEIEALAGKEPESVLREYRRANQLETEVEGLPTADDVVMPTPPKSPETNEGK